MNHAQNDFQKLFSLIFIIGIGFVSYEQMQIDQNIQKLISPTHSHEGVEKLSQTLEDFSRRMKEFEENLNTLLEKNKRGNSLSVKDLTDQLDDNSQAAMRELREDVEHNLIKIRAENYQENRVRIQSLRSELIHLRETMRFYLAEKNLIDQLPENKLKSSPSKKLDSLSAPPNLSLANISPDRKDLFPGYDFLMGKDYKILSTPSDGYFLFKDKCFSEFLGYSLSNLLYPLGQSIDVYFLEDYSLGNNPVTGTIQQYFVGSEPITHRSIQMLPFKPTIEIFRYLLIDFMLGNADRDFLFLPRTNKIIAIDVDDGFDYQSKKKIYMENPIYYTICGMFKSHDELPTILAKEQLRLQSISEEQIRVLFNLSKGKRWELSISPEEALENLLVRRKNLKEFITAILTAMQKGDFDRALPGDRD